jgi:predicted AAA+ superfamily ATPase
LTSELAAFKITVYSEHVAVDRQMKRLIETDLVAWKQSSRRKPLLVRGARQVGKTYSIEQFGRDHFSRCVTVDLERNRQWHRLFEGDLDVRQVVAELELVTRTRITPGDTLLFFDEIQSCPRAVMALRYLLEELPALHVVAAGSLLEFATSEVPFPVGRVQFLELHPLTFAEYLWAVGRDRAAEVVLSEPQALPETTHRLLLSEAKVYSFVGGMPESVLTYAESGSLAGSFEVQRELCEAYRQDFPKYTPRVDPDCLNAVLGGVAQRVGSQIRFTHLVQGYTHPTIKRAFEVLCKARLVTPVAATSPAGLPLSATVSPKRLKALLVDIGLWQHLCGLRTDVEYAKEDLLAVHKGAMAEHFVGQEMRVAQESELYYWSREVRGSAAEVDFLAVRNGGICPVEVKGGPSGRLRSLHMLLEEYPDCPRGLVFSSAPYQELPEQKLTFLPLYYAYSATRRHGPTWRSWTSVCPS